MASYSPAGPLSTAAAQSSVLLANVTAPSVVDLLVVYSPASRVRYGQSGLEAMIQQAVADANSALANSFATTVLRLVAMQEVNHVEDPAVDIGTVVGRMIVATDGFLDEVPVIRDQFGADVVSLVSEDTGASGVAYIPYFQGSFRPDWSYNVVASGSLLSGAFTHEVGHNLGCNHDRNNISSTGQAPYPYSFGLQQCGIDALGFRDIMSYECGSGLGFSQRLNYFSNPWLTYLGRPLGVDYAVDPLNACDNARTIREASVVVAGFRSSLQLLPAAPGTLGVTEFAFNQLDLTWLAGSANYAFTEVQRAGLGIENWAAIAFISGSATTYSDRGLAAGSAFRYRVRGVNSAGTGDFSPVTSGQTSPVGSAPAGVAGLTAGLVSKARIDLLWTDLATKEAGFRVERSANGGPFDVQAAVPYDTTGYNDGSWIQMGSTYVYRVTSYNGAGDGAVATVTLAVPTLPAPPTDLTITPLTATSAVVSWTDQSDNETGFDLQRSVDGVFFLTVATRTANVTSFTNNGLVNGVNYRYRVWSRNASGYSVTPSATASIVWGISLPAPSNLAALAASPTLVNLTWVDNATTETAYLVERAGTDAVYLEIGSVGANVTAYADTSVTAGTTFSYRVRATTGPNFSAYSAVVTLTTPATPPAAPSGLTATAVSPTQVNLVWVDNASNETSYLVERAISGGSYTQIASLAAGTTSFQNTAATPGTTYNYRVRASNSGGFSAYSAVATVVTPVAPPAAPTSLAATAVSSTQVNLSWVDTASNETSYLVERALSGGSYTQIATLAAGATVFQDTTATQLTSYDYRVRAANSAGFSAYSAVATVTTPMTPPAAPSGLTATAVSPTQVNLTWVDNASNETSYLVERAISGGSYTQLASLAADTTSFQNTAATPGTTYNYRVRASNSGGFSAYSAVVTVTTPLAPPTAPSSLTVSPRNSNSVRLAWLDNSSNESNFYVEQQTGSTWTVVSVQSANTTSVNVSGLNSNTAYTFRVRAGNSGGFSAYSNTATGSPR